MTDEELARRLVWTALVMKSQYRDAGMVMARVFCDARGIDVDALERQVSGEMTGIR